MSGFQKIVFFFDYGASRMGNIGDFIPKPLTRDFIP